MSIADLRQEYRRASLDQKDVVSDPFEQFQLWFDAAVNAQTPMANAMTLATVSAERQPSARMVLLKDFDHRGFVFYSNYESRKARELLQNPAAALLFYWIELERQIRIEGFIEKVSEQEADEYFASRPIGSRYAAIASPQSEVIRNRALLESRFEDAQRYHGENPRRPPYWGGYRLTPFTMEFWQGRVDRLHDRVRYARDSSGWSIARLAP